MIWNAGVLGSSRSDQRPSHHQRLEEHARVLGLHVEPHELDVHGRLSAPQLARRRRIDLLVGASDRVRSPGWYHAPSRRTAVEMASDPGPTATPDEQIRLAVAYSAAVDRLTHTTAGRASTS
jgi:hypothetical protein